MSHTPYSKDMFSKNNPKTFVDKTNLNMINEKPCKVCGRVILKRPQDGKWEHPHDLTPACITLLDDSKHHHADKIVQDSPALTPFMQVIEEIVELHNKKQNDYGRTDIGDPFANVRASEDFNIPGWIGAVIRANDKVRRIQKFARGGELVNESVEDSLIDAAVYFMIALCLFREQNGS